jgi:hypothetical protein
MNNDAPDEQHQLSRRGVVKTAAGVATVGAVAFASGRTPAEAASAPRTSAAAATAPDAVAHNAATETIVVHVRNPQTGELAFFVGEREIAVVDRALAAKLVAAAR